MNPWTFLTEEVKIVDPPPMGKGVISFQAWEHLKELIQLFQQYRLLQVMKARQVGVTWTLAGYALWTVEFNEGANVLLLSKGEDEAKEMLSRCALIHRELPDWLRLSLGPGGASIMTFPAMDSKIRALPATETAGRTETATLVICDEWDFHPYADANYAAVKPTIDAGGQFIGVSTVDKAKQDSLFKKLWRMGGESGFKQVFLGWEKRPGRDKRWYEETKKSYPDLVKWEQEYPSTAEEALAPSQGLCYFDVPRLKELLEGVRPGDTYKPYVVGRRYGAFIDPAGMGADSHSLSILDCQTGEFVVDYTTKESLEIFSLKANDILCKYQCPLLGIENNGVGLAMVQALKGLGYPDGKLVYQDEKRTKVGVAMTGGLRERILVDLALGIRQGGLIPYSRPAIDEMFSFINTEKGKPQAAQGAHDDRVMSMAGANWVGKQVVPAFSLVCSQSRHEFLTSSHRR